MEKDVLDQDDAFTVEQLSMDGISSPLASQIFDFGDDDADFLPETLRNSDVSSSSVNNTEAAGGGFGYDETSFSTDNFTLFPSMDAAEFSALLDTDELPPFDEMGQHLQTTTLPNMSCLAEQVHEQKLQFNQMSAVGNIKYINAGYSNDTAVLQQQQAPAVMFEEGFLPPALTLPSFLTVDLSTSCSFMDPGRGSNSFYGGACLGSGFLACSEGQGQEQGQGFLPEEFVLGPEPGMPLPELDYLRHDAGEGLGFSVPDQLNQNHTDHIQVNGDTQQMLSSSATLPAPATEMPTLDEPSYKVGQLSASERKEKIDRYIKKKNQRNFTKKIKYACRKTLADSRPRVRGRFAKNDELGEVTRPSFSLHELEEHEVLPKEEDDDILAHLSGLNSFKYKNYTALETWI